jgi:hypothetical protein
MGVKISELQEKTSTNDTDVLPIVDATGGTKKITVPNLLKTLTESISNIGGKVTNLTTYSTEEVKTGKFWNDGKPIYRKTLIYTNKEIANGTIIAHSIQNINEVTDFEVRFNDNGTLYTFPLIFEGTTSKMYARCNKTSIVFQSDGSLTLSGKTTRKLRVTIEYTRTTD